LPVIDGYEAARRIREILRDVVIIAQTAYSLSGDREKIMAAGFDEYIVKPIFPKQLIEKLVSVHGKKISMKTALGIAVNHDKPPGLRTPS